MSSAKAAIAFAALASLSAVQAVSEWGQCGGINYTGSTTCDSPYVCTYLNDYYYQCLPASSSSTTSTTTTSKSSTTTGKTTTSSTTSKTTTTSSSSKTTTTSTGTSKSSTTTTSSTKTTTSATSTGTCTLNNPYADSPTVYLSPYYVGEVNAAIATMTDSTLKTKAAAVAKVPNFVWFDQVSKVPTLSTYLADATSLQSSSGSQYLVQIVIYDLPNRDCAAKASNGEFTIANNGVANYKAYIDGISAAISAYPKVRVVAVVEPDSLANLVTNLSVQNCANAQSAYLECTTYVLASLTQCNIWLYLDAGHAGWLGWTSNLQPAATLFAQVYKSATPNRVRGLATDVANYNALSAATPDPITQGDPNTDELKYVTALSPLLNSAGFPASFIIDQGRSGVQDIRVAWGDWCNIKGAGFGMRPTKDTPSDIIDAIVWVKPGGECDGTSNSSSPRYDSTCSLSDAKQPAPEAGTWFEAYFEDLINYANPSF